MRYNHAHPNHPRPRCPINHPAFTGQDLSRFYGEFRALAPANFTIAAREIVALTGLNGAGKSTLLLCLSGLLRPPAGRCWSAVMTCMRMRSRPSAAWLLCLSAAFLCRLTAWEHLKFIAYAHNAEWLRSPRQAVLDELDLWEARDLYPHNYSRGMRLKLGLALALIRPFQVLVMDEPTSALDPQAVDYLVGKLRSLRDQGAAILLTSHNLELIPQFSARHWRMDKGILEQLS